MSRPFIIERVSALVAMGAAGYCLTVLAYIAVGLRLSNAEYQVDLAWFVGGAALFPFMTLMISVVLWVAINFIFWAADELGEKFGITMLGLSVAIMVAATGFATPARAEDPVYVPHGLERGDFGGIDLLFGLVGVVIGALCLWALVDDWILGVRSQSKKKGGRS